jgi:DivIVA domain-containing protein
MAITPADIEKKTFSTALRGYDLDEVDDFLDEMVVAVRELEGELTQARARIAELEQDPTAAAAAAAAATPPPAPAVDE